MRIPRINFYRKKVRKIKPLKFLFTVGLILIVGFSFYIVSTKMIEKIYEGSLAADRNLLSAAGISSLTSLSQDEMQKRIDDQIVRYSTLLNVKSRTLLSIKDTLENVDDFHFAFSSLQNVLEKLDGSVSLSYLDYTFKNATPLKISQFSLENVNTNILKKEEELFENLGYRVHVSKIGRSKWYKTTSNTIYLYRSTEK